MNITKSYSITGEKVLEEEQDVEGINQELLRACRIGSAYLGKAIADGFMNNCAMKPERALKIIQQAISQAERKGEK